MLRSLSIGLILFITGLSVSWAAEWDYRQETKIAWRNYDASAFAEARASGKPLYIFIYADWCHWCKKFEMETLETEEIRSLLQRETIPVLIDFVKQADLARRLGTQLVPTNIVVTADGKKLLRFYGLVEASDFADALQRTLQAWRRGELPMEEFGNESTCCPIPQLEK